MEFIGILGTLFILLAFSMKGEKRIRIYDTIGGNIICNLWGQR